MPNPAHRSRVRFALALLATAAVVSLACTPETPEARVQRLRGEYVAELNSFHVEAVPIVVEPPADEAMAGEAAAEGGDAAAGGDEGATDEAAAPVYEVRQDVVLDVLLRKQVSDDRLPGVTVDVSQVDADKTEKARFHFYVETAGLAKGESKQVTQVLEDVDYSEGDGFFAEVRGGVEPDSYGDYRELREAGQGG